MHSVKDSCSHLEFNNGVLEGKNLPSIQGKNQKENSEILHSPTHI